MNGRALALGAVGALALVGLARSRSGTTPLPSSPALIPVYAGATYLSRTAYRGFRPDTDRVQDVVEGVKLGQRRATAADWIAKNRELQGPALVCPVPRSAASSPSLLPLAEALIERGVGDEVRVLLVRHTVVPSSRLRRREGRPGVSSAQHQASVMAAPPGPGEDLRPLLLVDDVFTLGNTSLAMVQKLRAAGWRGPIRVAVVALVAKTPADVQGLAIGPRSRTLEVEPTGSAARFDPTASPAFKRWFGDSKVVDSAGHPLVVWHGTDYTGPKGKGIDRFASKGKAHLGFHFGTREAAEHKLEADRHNWIDRKRKTPVPLHTDTHKEAGRLRITKQIDALTREASRIQSQVSARTPGPDLQATAAAYQSDDDARIAAYWAARDAIKVPPTPQEATRLRAIQAEIDALFEERAYLFLSARPGESLVPVYLSIKNPAEMNDCNWGSVPDILRSNPGWNFEDPRSLTDMMAELRDRGYDGIVYENEVEAEGSISWIAFRPTQIKSALSNRGTYSADDSHISYNRR